MVHTWAERLAQIQTHAEGLPYRPWLGVYPERAAWALAQAARELAIGLRVSEEQYADLYCGTERGVVVYWTGPIVDLTAYWQRVYTLTGWQRNREDVGDDDAR